MKTPEQWKKAQRELNEFIILRRSLSRRIHELRMSIRQHNKRVANPPDKTNTFAYQMFGKRLKDLTPEELREYYNARQKINRANRKNGIYKRKRKED